MQDNTHLYFFGYNVALHEWMIAMRNGPTVTILATSAPFALNMDQDYTVRADLNGSSLELSVGGVLMDFNDRRHVCQREDRLLGNQCPGAA